MQPEVRLKTRQLIPSAFVQENFGMSEGMLFFVRLDDPQEVKLETCGRPICPDDEVRLVDDEGSEVPPGEVGELTCRGPYTLRGYYGVPEYNARQFTPDGFYRSGDLMRRHPSGNYVVEGRKKDLINRGGEKISAEEIENLILLHPAVQNVACVPVPDPNLGEKMCACVVLKTGAGCRSRSWSISSRGRRSRSSSCRSGWRYFAISRYRLSARCRRRRCRKWSRKMRIIDLHCYPGTRNGSPARDPTSRRSPSTGSANGSASARTRS